jgi:hypothetical protein
MKIKDIRGTAPSKKPSPVNEAEHQPRVGGKIYDAIKRNLAVIGAEEKQDIVSLLQTPGGATATQTTSAATEPVDPIAARRQQRQATAAAAAQKQMNAPAVWRNPRTPAKPATARPAARLTPSPATGMRPAPKPAPGVNPDATPSPETGMNPAAAPKTTRVTSGGPTPDELKKYQAKLDAAAAVQKESKKKITAKDDPCWSGYHMVGTKKKGNREVPNCVPGKKGA